MRLLGRRTGPLDRRGAEDQSAEERLQQQIAARSRHHDAELGGATAGATGGLGERNAEPAHFRVGRPVGAAEPIGLVGARELALVLERVLVREQIPKAVVQELALLTRKCRHR